MKTINKNRLGLLALITMAVGSANAATTPIDVSEIVGVITAGVVTVSAIGIAVLSLVVTIKVFKWARAAM